MISSELKRENVESQVVGVCGVDCGESRSPDHASGSTMGTSLGNLSEGVSLCFLSCEGFCRRERCECAIIAIIATTLCPSLGNH